MPAKSTEGAFGHHSNAALSKKVNRILQANIENDKVGCFIVVVVKRFLNLVSF